MGNVIFADTSLTEMSWLMPTAFSPRSAICSVIILQVLENRTISCNRRDHRSHRSKKGKRELTSTYICNSAVAYWESMAGAYEIWLVVTNANDSWFRSLDSTRFVHYFIICKLSLFWSVYNIQSLWGNVYVWLFFTFAVVFLFFVWFFSIQAVSYFGLVVIFSDILRK